MRVFELLLPIKTLSLVNVNLPDRPGASVGRGSLCGITTAKLSPTKTRLAGRFFRSPSRRSKVLRKGQIAGQSSTVGYRLLRCVSISQMKQTSLAPWPFQIPRPQRSPANAVNNALPLPLRLNLNPLPEDRSRGSGRGRLSLQVAQAATSSTNYFCAEGTRSGERFESYSRIAAQPMSKKLPSSTALHETVEQFHILVDSLEEYAIYLLDPSGNVITWNTGAEKIKGYSMDEIIGKNFASFYTADDVAAGSRNVICAKRAVADPFVIRVCESEKGIDFRSGGCHYFPS